MNAKNEKLESRNILSEQIALTDDRRFNSLCKYLTCETPQDPLAQSSTDRTGRTIVEEMEVNVRGVAQVVERNTRQRG